MVMLERWSVLRRENDHVREVVTLMEGVVMLRRLSLQWKEKGHQRVRWSV